MKILRIELKRSFKNIGTCVAALVGVLCVIYNKYLVFHRISQSHKLAESFGIHIYEEGSKLTFYDYWLVGNFETGTLYLVYFLGLIAALPYGISYYKDRKSGLIRNICVRTEKKKYLSAKYVATFISGGVVSVVPIFLDFMIAKLCVPVDFLRIQDASLMAIDWWGVFVIDHLYVAAFIYMLLWFVFGGALATISLATSTFTDNFFTIQLMPFFITLIAAYIPNLFPGKFNKWLPLYFLTNWGMSNPLYCIIVTVVVILMTFSVYYIKETKRDIY